MTIYVLDRYLRYFAAQLSKRSRSSLSLVCLFFLCMSACAGESPQLESGVMGDVTKGDGISDVSDQDVIEQDWGKAGEGRYGGVLLISGLSGADCLAYPISDQLLVIV